MCVNGSINKYSEYGDSQLKPDVQHRTEFRLLDDIHWDGRVLTSVEGRQKFS